VCIFSDICMSEMWTCKYCQNILELKSKFTKSGHLARCKEWYKFRDENLNKDILTKLYVDEHKSLPEIAELFSLDSVTSIDKQLKKFKIKTRTSSEASEFSLPKIKKINLERYGFENVLSKNCAIRLQLEAEHLHQYGVINFGQFEKVKKKIVETCLRKYGVESPAQSPEIMKKMRDSLFKRFGVNTPGQLPTQRNKYTKIHKKLVYALQLDGIIVNIEKCLKFDNKIYFFDIWFDNSNLLIEVNGDYFHANPLKYQPDYLIPLKKKTAQEIWDYDALKIKRATDAGYQILVVWESEIKTLTGLELVKQKIIELLKQE
jgi:G:T-mismatch repair DNA endonuclease (very short patch repair protein)